MQKWRRCLSGQYGDPMRAAAGARRRSKRGRPSYVPTDKDRKVVESMAAYGITQNDISLAIGIAPMTLRKHFADELATAHVKANARVSEIATTWRLAANVRRRLFFGLSAALDGGRQRILSIRERMERLWQPNAAARSMPRPVEGSEGKL